MATSSSALADPRSHATLVRTQVVGAGRRLDVSLPARVPVWEFLPEVLRALEWPEEMSVTTVVTAGGAALDPDRELREQGVEDGDVLTVAASGDHAPAVLHDDLVETVHTRVQSVVVPWRGVDSRLAGAVTGLVGAALALALVLVARPSGVTGFVVPVGALLVSALSACLPQLPSWLTAAAGWLSVLAAWIATGAVTAAAPGLGGWLPYAVSASTGLVLLLGAGPTWPLRLPPVVALGAEAAARAVEPVVGVPAWQLVVLMLVGAVVLAGVAPPLVAEVTVQRGRGGHAAVVGVDPPPASVATTANATARVTVTATARAGADHLDADLLLAHRLLTSLHLCGTLLLLSVTPAAIAHGPLAVGALALLVALRTVRLRHQRSRTHVLAGLVGGGVWCVVATTCLVAADPALLPLLGTGVLVASTVAALGAVAGDRVRGPGWELGRGWCVDVVEVALMVLVPAAVTVSLWWPRW